MDQFRAIKNTRVLVDTNILVYCGNKEFGHQAKGLLRTLKDNGNDLAVSFATCFELIKNAIDEKLREYCFSLITYIDNIPITKEIIMSGSYLYHVYSNKGITGYKSIESMDIIIAGTVVYHRGALLLTANRKHFPMPFWKNVCQGMIIYKDGEENRLINIYLLEFDYSQIPNKNKEEK